MATLKEYPVNEVEQGLIKKLKKYTNDQNFDPEKCNKVCSALTGLCIWVLNV